MLAYVVTLLPGIAWTPLKITRIGTEHRDLATEGDSLIAAALAILCDYTGRDPEYGAAVAFAAMIFAPHRNGIVSQTITGETVARFVDAVGRRTGAAA